MPTTTLKEAERELGLSPDDTVQYEKNGNEAVIRIQLSDSKKSYSKRDKKTAKEISDYILVNAEPLETDNWAEDFKRTKRIPE